MNIDDDDDDGIFAAFFSKDLIQQSLSSLPWVPIVAWMPGMQILWTLSTLMSWVEGCYVVWDTWISIRTLALLNRDVNSPPVCKLWVFFYVLEILDIIWENYHDWQILEAVIMIEHHVIMLNLFTVRKVSGHINVVAGYIRFWVSVPWIETINWWVFM